MSIPANANTLLLNSAAAAAGGYQISRSVRFNSADSAYLTKTFATGNRKTWTWAGWVKRSAISRSGVNSLFGRFVDNYNHTVFRFDSTDKLDIRFTIGTSGSNTIYQLDSVAVFRDPSAWYHVVIACDTTAAVATDRVKAYINGTQIALTGTSWPSNTDTFINTNTAHQIGNLIGVTDAYFDGYLAEIHFCDGTAYDASAFGEFDDNGIWRPIDASGLTYGTNGFYLEFADNSTAAALGTDTSGNGNTWTVNNLSVTAGAGNDSLVDSPTNYGTDTGVGSEVRGNYCTLNPLAEANVTLSNGNLDVSYNSASAGYRTTFYITAGKWYWETTPTAIAAPITIGVIDANSSITSQLAAGGSTGVGYKTDGTKEINGAGSAYGSSIAANDVVGVAIDVDSGTIQFYKNGVAQGSISYTFTGKQWSPVANSNATGSHSLTYNFGQRPFAYSAPSGYKSLCTANLPAPVITKPSSVFDALTYTGITQSPRTITGLDFTPSFVWVKNRSISSGHYLWDAVRGTDKNLRSDGDFNEAAVSAAANGIISTSTTGGFIVKNGNTTGTNVGSAGSDAYIAWTWDAGSSTVTNTQGSITSQVRSNGYLSIVTYTGNGIADATVGHGLGVVPEFWFIKSRDGARDWYAYTQKVDGSLDFLVLNDTSVKTNSSANNPTSTTFSLIGPVVNSSGEDYVAYCFAGVDGYSSFGSYTGNGSSTDGSFVFCNFRPRWILLKRTDTTGNWTIIDTAREGYNVDNDPLFPNLSNAEGTTDLADILSNGFKLRSTDASVNANTGTYVYAAFAESPFSLARAR